MATSKIGVSEGSGKNVSTYSFTEDSVTKEIQRIVLGDSNGVEKGTAANPQIAAISPAIGGGWTPFPANTLSNTKQEVKATAGTLGGYILFNPNAATVYIQVWNLAAASVTVGTTAPTYVIALAAGATANVEFTNGIKHDTGITVAATTTPTGSSAPTSSLVATFLKA